MPRTNSPNSIRLSAPAIALALLGGAILNLAIAWACI
jgi:hypothetical protein